MEQLNNFDAFMVAGESRRTPYHIAHMRIYDPSTSADPVVRFKTILNRFESRLHMAPLFRKRMVKTPLDLDNPYWIESPDFNVETHVRHIALPKPGDWRQLCILVARLHSQPLNLAKPLWEAYVIEGLDDVEGMPEGAFAVLIKMHHSIVDGAAADAMLEAIHDEEPTVDNTKKSTWKTESEPTAAQMFEKSALNYLKQPFKTFRGIRNIVSSEQEKRRFGEEYPEHLETQKELCIFNGAVSAHRVFGAIITDIDDIKKIKNRVEGATINDVMMCITSFSVEKYLEHHGEQVNEVLRGGFAVNTRDMTRYSDGYNAAAPAFQSVHSDLDDPLERLAAIHESGVVAKEYMRRVGSDRMRNVLEALPPFTMSTTIRLAGRYEWMANQQSGAHYAITNVPGPRSPRYLAGAKVICSFGIGPVLDSSGLIHVISSYCDKLTISFQSCREMMPDPEFYSECLQDAFDLMLATTKKKKKKKA